MTEADASARLAGRRRFRARFALLTIGLAIAGVSCAENDAAAPSAITDAARSSSTTTSTATAPAPTAPTTTEVRPSTAPPIGRSIDDEIIARYIGFWEARFAANSGVPNPDDPALREFATGAQLETVVNETRANLDQGLAFRRAANPSDIQQVSVTEVNGDRAVVQECVVADGVIVRRDTGAVVNDDVATQNVRGELVRVDGVWKVASARLIQRWEEVAGCARAS